MEQTYPVRCSNCGGWAIRSHGIRQVPEDKKCSDNRVTQTECPSCDYLMTIGQL